jgi:hypothetical protein
MVQTISVKDIALKILQPGETMESAVNRIKNWTREGLITPVGDRHPGTGRARQYPRKVLYEAALLQKLIDCTGIGAIEAGPLLKEVKKRADVTSLVSEIRGAGMPVLVICRSSGEGKWGIAVGQLEEFPKIALKNPHDTYTIVDLKRLFDTSSQD